MSKENRQHPRSAVNWPVTIKTPQETVSARIRDVSPGGAFIYCDRPMTPKHIFSYQFISTLVQSPFQVWRNRYGQHTAEWALDSI